MKTSRSFKEFTDPFSNKTDCLKKVRCDVSKAGSVERELTLVLHSILNWIQEHDQFDFHIQNRKEEKK